MQKLEEYLGHFSDAELKDLEGSYRAAYEKAETPKEQLLLVAYELLCLITLWCRRWQRETATISTTAATRSGSSGSRKPTSSSSR